MRVNLPLLVALSVAAHFCLLGGLAWWQMPIRVPRPAPAPALATLVLIPPPQAPPDLPHPLRPAPEVSTRLPVGKAARSSLPAREETPPLLAPLPARERATAPPGAGARAPLFPPEQVLDPVHPPTLAARDGVLFVLDLSGSMYEPYAGSTRLALARARLATLIDALPDQTPFSLVVYAQSARGSGPLVAATPATRTAAKEWLGENFDCGGGTNLGAGMALAQRLGAGTWVLVTDGDLHVSPAELSVSARHALGGPGQNPAVRILAIAPRAGTPAPALLQELTSLTGGACLTIDSLPGR